MTNEEPHYDYPRTRHLPWSPGGSKDDLRLSARDPETMFGGRRVIVTEKLDGENTSMYNDILHARSRDGQHHPAQDWVRSLHATLKGLGVIPPGWRFCGENMYERHNIPYDHLNSYFYLFSIWDESNVCLSWDETVTIAQDIGLEMPEVWYDGQWDERVIRHVRIDTDRCEGYVIRTAGGFAYDAFDLHVAKWVRPEHLKNRGQPRNRVVFLNHLAPNAAPLGGGTGKRMVPDHPMERGSENR